MDAEMINENQNDRQILHEKNQANQFSFLIQIEKQFKTINNSFSSLTKLIYKYIPQKKKQNFPLFICKTLNYLNSKQIKFTHYYFPYEYQLHQVILKSLISSQTQPSLNYVLQTLQIAVNQNILITNTELYIINQLMLVLFRKLSIFPNFENIIKLIVKFLKAYPTTINIIFNFESAFEGFEKGILSKIENIYHRQIVYFIIFQKFNKIQENLTINRCKIVIQGCLQLLPSKNTINYMQGLLQIIFKAIQKFPNILQEMLKHSIFKKQQIILQALNRLILFFQRTNLSNAKTSYCQMSKFSHIFAKTKQNVEQCLKMYNRRINYFVVYSEEKSNKLQQEQQQKIMNQIDRMSLNTQL